MSEENDPGKPEHEKVTKVKSEQPIGRSGDAAKKKAAAKKSATKSRSKKK